MQAVRSVAQARQQRSNDINDHYRIGKVIGKGTFAAVHLCVDKEDNKEWAVKVSARRSGWRLPSSAALSKTNPCLLDCNMDEWLAFAVEIMYWRG